jgi:hypothetical protein
VTIAILLGTLAILDCAIAGFRAAAGRNGELDKRRYYRAAMLRGGLVGCALVALFAGAVELTGTWPSALSAAHTLVWIYGTYATVVLVAFAFYFTPVGPYRVLTSVIVFGPLTLIRRAVIAGGMGVVALTAQTAPVTILAAGAGVAMLAVEPLLGRRYARLWESLRRPETTEGPGGNPGLRSG